MSPGRLKPGASSTAPPESGYSGTPLVDKLGIRIGHVVYAERAPDDYSELLQPLPARVAFTTRVSAAVDVAHLFAYRRDELAKRLELMRRKLKADAALWISWPKKASKVPTTLTEDVIRELALPLGFVDIKVCAVNEVWSGLKLVVRKELR